MGGSVMFSCRTALPLDVKSLKKVSLKYKSESEAVVRKTMEHSAYVPRVENISPAPPANDVTDEAPLQVSKDDLLHQITDIDKKITRAEAEIKVLGKKLLELQTAADLPEVGNEEKEIKKPQSPALAIKIYAENKRKHRQSDILWEKLGPKIVMPLYNQPSDTTVYHENRKKHLVFKYCLLKFLKCKQVESSIQENYLIALYMEKKQEWLNKVKAIESSLAHKKKEAEKKIIFEREFPKLRKQIEEKRKQRLSQIESHFGSGDKSESACAIICPILLPSRQQEFRYINNNGLIKDLPAEYKEWQLINVWTDAEKAIFKEKFLQHPKQFSIIASYLDQKNIPECVEYYYQSKQTENYKSLVRKTRKRAHMNCNGLPTKRANIAQLNSGKVYGGHASSVTSLQAEKMVRQGLYRAAVESDDVEPAVQSSLVPQAEQPSLVESVDCGSSSLMPSPASMSDASTLNVEAPATAPIEPPAGESGNIDSSRNQDGNMFDTGKTPENAGFKSDEQASFSTDCDTSHEKERKEAVEITASNKEYEIHETKPDVHNGMVRSIMLDHSKHLPQPDVSQYSVCKEEVPSTHSCKFHGGGYTPCQVLAYKNSPNHLPHCSTQWNDSEEKQSFPKVESETLQSFVSSKHCDVSTVGESYNAAAPVNVQPITAVPVAMNNESIRPETSLQAVAHSSDKPLYGSQNYAAVMKPAEESYRSLVIKATSRCDEGLNHAGGRLHHQPPKLGNGIVQPHTSSVAEDVPLDEGAGGKQVQSVKDLVMEVIEKQIMKNFGKYDDGSIASGEGKGALAPTLSSILQTHHLAVRSQSDFMSGFQAGAENRSLHLSQESSPAASHHQSLPLGQKQRAPQMPTYPVLAGSSQSSHDYMPEGKESNFLCSHNFQSGDEVGKRSFPSSSVIASRHRLPSLLPTASSHHSQYPLSSVHQAVIHSTPRSSPVYLPRRGAVVDQTRHHQTLAQGSEGTLDLSTKKLRAYHPPGLLSEELRRWPFQNQSVHQPSQVPHYQSQSTIPTVQRKVHPQELLPPVSSSPASVHRNRYASVISQSVIVREQVHDFGGELSAVPDNHRAVNSSSGCTSSVGAHASTTEIEAMANMYKPYFP